MLINFIPNRTKFCLEHAYKHINSFKTYLQDSAGKVQEAVPVIYYKT